MTEQQVLDIIVREFRALQLPLPAGISSPTKAWRRAARRIVDECTTDCRAADRQQPPLLRSRAGSRRQALWEIVNAAGPNGMMKAEIIDACRDAIDSTPSSIATMLTLLRRQGRMERFDGGIWRATTFRTEQVMLRRKGVNP